jgi:hypothetical protein
MVKKTLGFLAALVLSGALSGCIVHTRDRGHRRSRVSKSSRCHPSQYWDGHTCRHKGKGHGARKHDGPRR